MDSRPPLTLAEQLAAAQAWWREAGVDSDFADAPRNWLEGERSKAQSERTEAPEPLSGRGQPPAVPPLGGDAATWPDSLADFARWWLTNEQLEAGGTAARVSPRGAANAALMVLVPMPEASDTERLLSGPQGQLVANMLRAMGIAEDTAYLASALPRHVRHPDWQALAARELGQIVNHHVRLVAPRRLLVLGRAMLPLFGHDPAQAGAKPREFALQGCPTPALVSYVPETLLETARFRAALWRGWLDWTGGGQ